jgi:hypothetical protein
VAGGGEAPTYTYGVDEKRNFLEVFIGRRKSVR